jgi:hypothetical protein
MKGDSLVLRIEDPTTDGFRKLESGISELIKAYRNRFGIDINSSHQEQSPYLAMRELEEQIVGEVEDGLYQLFSQISLAWLRTPLMKARSFPFKLNGRIFINPRTGRPLTDAEWRIIVHDIEKALGHIFKGSKDLLVYKAMALGKILQSYPNPGDAPSLSSLVIPRGKLPSYLDASSKFAEQHAAEHITSLIANTRKRIATTIIEAQRSRLGPRSLEKNLFDQFAALNRDWRRVAQTEFITNANNSVLVTTREQGKAEGETHSFLIGISSPNACSWCASHVRGKVVVVLDHPPKNGDQVRISGKTYTAVWEGKDNYGRARSDWWAASGTQHPYCRCAWNRFIPQIASAYAMLNAT